ncbi:hypothetical protein GE594_10215 [Salmonella enterica]|nr:hypothetical protein [Salmonella enterica]
MNEVRDTKGRFVARGVSSYGGFIVCEKCGIEKECIPENFRILNKNSKCQSISKICRKCKNAETREKYHKRKQDPEFASMRKKAQEKFRRNNREKVLLRNYIEIDKKKGQECTLTVEFVKNLIEKPCIYCGDTERIGADRIDNSKPHTPDNVHPCCADCNTARSDKFTVDEMMIIGSAIRKVKEMRK